MIDGWLTEVNVTSPAGFRTYARLTGVRLETRVVDWLEERCAPASPLALGVASARMRRGDRILGVGPTGVSGAEKTSAVADVRTRRPALSAIRQRQIRREQRIW